MVSEKSADCTILNVTHLENGEPFWREIPIEYYWFLKWIQRSSKMELHYAKWL